ncbi:hypothetical protein [Ferrimonas balearica]|uniref:hypothetical protein n=1 Tax=Ferrimonas balearica TaxID=44012 RepID=UPI001C5908B1|nr:hypothetical protein [Ferrimonas balearica]MBW3163735.1 hypothetical protein [Ferrimonas balearica]
MKTKSFVIFTLILMASSGCVETRLTATPDHNVDEVMPPVNEDEVIPPGEEEEKYTETTLERIYVSGRPDRLFYPLIINPRWCIEYDFSPIVDGNFDTLRCNPSIIGYQHQWGLTSTLDVSIKRFDPNHHADAFDELTLIEIVESRFEPKGTAYIYENIEIQDGFLRKADDSHVYYLSNYPITCRNRIDCLYLTDKSNFGAIVNLEIVIDGQGGAEIARWY